MSNSLQPKPEPATEPDRADQLNEKSGPNEPCEPGETGEDCQNPPDLAIAATGSFTPPSCPSPSNLSPGKLPGDRLPRYGTSSRTADPRRDSGVSLAAINQDKSIANPAYPTRQAAARKAKAAGPPTRDRKLKHLSQEQVNAARALVKPQPPVKPGKAIVFEPDDTPANAEEILSAPARPVAPIRPVRHGPLPASAPTEQQAMREEIRAAREEISPYPHNERDLEEARNSTGSRCPAATENSPELTDPELAQIIRLVQDKYGPILNIDQAAEISKLAKQTIRERVSQGLYASSVKRGRPLRFWAHRFVAEVMR